MSSVDNVTAGKPKLGGSCSVAPKGTTLPTSATATLATAFKSLGYISEDGLANENTPTVTWIKAWGGDNVLPVYGAKEDKYKFKLLEALNVDVLKTVYGPDNVSVESSTGDITVKHNNADIPSQSFIFDMILKGNIVKRIVIAEGWIESVSEIKYADSEAVGYEVTVGAVPGFTDTSGAIDGDTAKEYIHKPTTTGGGSAEG